MTHNQRQTPHESALPAPYVTATEISRRIVEPQGLHGAPFPLNSTLAESIPFLSCLRG